ncbi:hypothetical protein ILUMI_25737 [Ignelater luminosus]|uniref:Uncharacterized protein n=1 Tax=Ignelater luminosus TaxID=2038154 RepID=A0A8K0C6W4_IGNLU|nr:hypothetical protein ILUMI_25737 [Ignelater luminosus]
MDKMRLRDGPQSTARWEASMRAGQTPYGEINGRENPKIISYIDDIYRQNQQYQEKWPKNSQDDRFGNKNQYLPDTNQNPKENWQQQNSVQADESERAQYYNHQSEQNTSWKPEKQVSDHHDHDHEKIAHELKHSKELMENANSNKNKDSKQIKIEKVQKHANHDHVQYAKMTQYKVAEVLDLQDGIAETPGGAVLSLTLGLIITCIMALLIGCRLRVVRRRIRRGGKSYAHDADYLVNGMYL